MGQGALVQAYQTYMRIRNKKQQICATEHILVLIQADAEISHTDSAVSASCAVRMCPCCVT